MLMPILSVKAPIAAAQGTSAVEAAPSAGARANRRHPRPDLGTQSEAVLKILETLNRHLLGTEPLPKGRPDPPARHAGEDPEISTFAAGDIARFHQAAGPSFWNAASGNAGGAGKAAGAAQSGDLHQDPRRSAEDALAQRYAAPARQAVVMPAIPRAGSTLPDGRPLPAATVQQGQAQVPVPGRPAPANIPQMIVPNPAHIADPGLLQAALKRRLVLTIRLPPSLPSKRASTGTARQQRRVPSDPRSKGQTASGNGTAATSGQPQQTAKANSDTIPLLRAAAAFLADDPEALSQVATITSGMDDQLKAELVEELGLDLAEPKEMSTQPERSSGAAGAQAQTGGDEFGTAQARPDTADQAVPPASSAAEGERTEADGVTVLDPGEREIDLQDPSIASADEMPSSFSETEMDHPEKSLAQTLKALVEASLPLPGAAPDKTGTLFALMAGDTADMGAEILFAQLEAADIDGGAAGHICADRRYRRSNRAACRWNPRLGAQCSIDLRRKRQAARCRCIQLLWTKVRGKPRPCGCPMPGSSEMQSPSR